MAMIRRDLLALAGAGGIAALMPVVLLLPRTPHIAIEPKPAPVPLVPDPAPTLAALYERPLFGTASPSSAEAMPADAPGLIGIAGRLGEDAVALVRTGEGATRALRVGESVDGWTLASLAIDAAYFTRGSQRVRVPLPAGDDEAQ